MKILFFLLAFAAAAPAAPLLTILPSGAAAGLPGTTVGWGLELFNDTGMLLVTASEWAGQPTYVDLAGPLNLVAGEAPYTTSVSVAYNALTAQGLGALLIPPGAPALSLLTGQIRVYFDYYSLTDADPNFVPYCLDQAPPGACTVLLGQSQTFDVTVQVLGTEVPEPHLLLPAGLAILALLARLRRRA